MGMDEFVKRIPEPSTKDDPVPSLRAVVKEVAIFAERCPHCGVKAMYPCCNDKGELLSPELNTTEFRFHPQRILEAIRTRLTETMVGNLTAGERMLIVYYAFVLQCDAMAANSEKLFSKKQTSQDIQSFFAQCAITELLKDQLIRDPRKSS